MAIARKLLDKWLKEGIDYIPQPGGTIRMTYSDPRYLFSDFESGRLKSVCGCGPSCRIVWHPNVDPLSRTSEFTHSDGKHYSKVTFSDEVLRYAYQGTTSAIMEHLVRQCQNDHVAWSKKKRYVRTWGEDER